MENFYLLEKYPQFDHPIKSLVPEFSRLYVIFSTWYIGNGLNSATIMCSLMVGHEITFKQYEICQVSYH